jgi:streptomycin 6-kinase
MELPVELANFCKVHNFHPTEEIVTGFCSRVFFDSERALKYPLVDEERKAAVIGIERLSLVGGPKLLAVHEPTKSVLMERVRPGSTLSQANLEDAEAQSIVMRFIAGIFQRDSTGATELKDYFSQPDPMLSHLLETSIQRVFLHGDLHHENVLLGANGWQVIDAKALVGDPNYEAIAFLRNPISWIPQCPDLKEATRKRLGRFKSELGLDPWRILAWALVDRRSSPPCKPGDPWYPLLTLYEELLTEYPEG